MSKVAGAARRSKCSKPGDTLATALDAYRALLTAEGLEMFRSVLTEQLANDPMIARLVRSAGEAPDVDRSDEIPIFKDEEATPEPAKQGAARGQRRRPKG